MGCFELNFAKQNAEWPNVVVCNKIRHNYPDTQVPGVRRPCAIKCATTGAASAARMWSTVNRFHENDLSAFELHTSSSSTSSMFPRNGHILVFPKTVPKRNCPRCSSGGSVPGRRPDVTTPVPSNNHRKSARGAQRSCSLGVAVESKLNLVHRTLCPAGTNPGLAERAHCSGQFD